MLAAIPELAHDMTHVIRVPGDHDHQLPVAYQIDYLLTWNCTHIANGHTIKRLAGINDRLGKQTPVIVTPEELFEE